MKSLRHASRLVTLLGLTLACATANAALMINVEGVRGSGVTTWTLSGSSTTGTNGGIVGISTDRRLTRLDGRIQFDKGVQFFSATGEERRRLIQTLRSRLPLTLTGSAKLTVDAMERTISHLSVSPFGFTGTKTSGDVLVFHVDRELSYRGGRNSSWSGSFTLNLDISNFKIGTFRESHTPISFFARELVLTFEETPASVPEPSSLALLGLALMGLGVSRKLKGATSRA